MISSTALRADEETALAQAIGEVPQAVGDPAVQVPNRGVILGVREVLVWRNRLTGRLYWHESLCVHPLHPLWTLQEEEVGQSRLTEREQAELDARRKVVGPAREVRPCERRGGPDCRHQVRDECEVEHLLHSDALQDGAPPIDRRELLCCQALLDTLLQTEACIEVLAHDPVLELGGLGQQIPEMLAMLDDDRWFAHSASIMTAAGVSGTRRGRLLTVMGAEWRG